MYKLERSEQATANEQPMARLLHPIVWRHERPANVLQNLHDKKTQSERPKIVNLKS